MDFDFKLCSVNGLYPHDLGAAVKTAVREGWQLHGAPFYNFSTHQICQAMVKSAGILNGNEDNQPSPQKSSRPVRSR